LFFNLRRTKSQISALEDGDLRPEQVTIIARRLLVSEDDVIQMNRRLGGDASLNAPIGKDADSGDWQDWLVDNAPSQERMLIETEKFDRRRAALSEALVVLNDRERQIFIARHLVDEPATLEVLAQEFGISRERVRQIEVRSLEKVSKLVRLHIATEETSQAVKPHHFCGGRTERGQPALAARPRVSPSHRSLDTAAA
jgi:RNA polymerase sigma-32 factor